MPRLIVTIGALAIIFHRRKSTPLEKRTTWEKRPPAPGPGPEALPNTLSRSLASPSRAKATGASLDYEPPAYDVVTNGNGPDGYLAIGPAAMSADQTSEM